MDILIFSIFTNLVYFCCGSIFVSNKKLEFHYQFFIYFFGVVTIGLISLTLNFFTPLSQNINSIVYILIILVFTIKSKFKFHKKNIIFLIISSLITFLLIFNSTVNRPDAGLYHLPYISLIEENKIIFGASNIHFRFGHVSILQYLSAINNNHLFLENGISIPLASIVSFFYIYFFYDVWSIFKKKKITNLAKFFSLFVLIYISLKITRYSSFGNDAVGHLSFFYIISCILKNDLKKLDIKKLLLISVFAFLNKPTLGLIFFIPATVFILQNNLDIKKMVHLFFSFPSFLLYLWLIKNIIVSGCAIFLIKITCIESLSWTNLQQITDATIEGNAWAKGWPDRLDSNVSMEEFSKNLNWLKSWSSEHLRYILNTIAPFVAALIIIIFYIKIMHKKLLNYQDKSFVNNLILPLIISGIGSILFFFYFSIYRYGYSYLITFIILIMLLFIKDQILSKEYSRLFKFIFMCCLAIVITKSVIKIYKQDSQTAWPNIYTLDVNNHTYEKSKINHNNNFYYYLADRGDQLCMYSKSPCTTYPIKKNIKHIQKYTYKMLIVN